MMKYFALILTLGLFLNLSSCARRVIVHESSNSKIVRVLPKKHTVVRINGKRYYRWNGRHYRKTRNGYVVVKV